MQKLTLYICQMFLTVLNSFKRLGLYVLDLNDKKFYEALTSPACYIFFLKCVRLF